MTTSLVLPDSPSLYPIVHDLSDAEYGETHGSHEYFDDANPCCPCDASTDVFNGHVCPSPLAFHCGDLAMPLNTLLPMMTASQQQPEQHSPEISESYSETVRPSITDLLATATGSSDDTKHSFGSRYDTVMMDDSFMEAVTRVSSSEAAVGSPTLTPQNRKRSLRRTLFRYRSSRSLSQTSTTSLEDEQTEKTTTGGTDAGSDGLTVAASSPTVTFDCQYVLTRQIFECTKSAVSECVHRNMGIRYCVKIISFKTLPPFDRVLVQREVETLRQLQTGNSPYIVRLHQLFESRNKIHIVMNLVTGGNLLSRVVQNGCLPEPTVKKIIYGVLQGLLHIQSFDLCHNDLNPSNILLDADDNAVITDFGSCSRINTNLERLPRPSAYCAPEVTHYLTSCAVSDMWSVGVLVYYCLMGHTPPHWEESSSNASSANQSSRLDFFPVNEWYPVSRYAKQLMSGCLHHDHTVRLTVQEALEHAWYSSPSESVSSTGARKSNRQQHLHNHLRSWLLTRVMRRTTPSQDEISLARQHLNKVSRHPRHVPLVKHRRSVPGIHNSF